MKRLVHLFRYEARDLGIGATDEDAERFNELVREVAEEMGVEVSYFRPWADWGREEEDLAREILDEAWRRFLGEAAGEEG